MIEYKIDIERTDFEDGPLVAVFKIQPKLVFEDGHTTVEKSKGSFVVQNKIGAPPIYPILRGSATTYGHKRKVAGTVIDYSTNRLAAINLAMSYATKFARELKEAENVRKISSSKTSIAELVK